MPWRVFMKYAPCSTGSYSGFHVTACGWAPEGRGNISSILCGHTRAAKKSAGVDVSTLRGPVPAKMTPAHLYNHTLVNVRARTTGQSLINRFIWHPGCFSL